jgi:hypothetical protein
VIVGGNAQAVGKKKGSPKALRSKCDVGPRISKDLPISAIWLSSLLIKMTWPVDAEDSAGQPLGVSARSAAENVGG